MVNDLLWHEDRASMAVGLEVRVPYLDLDLATQARQRSRREAMPYGRRPVQSDVRGAGPPHAPRTPFALA